MVFFITGASSFIGIELCHYLSDNGHEVIAMTRRANGHLDEIAKDGRLNVFIADLQTLAEVSQKIRADVFVHLAWAGTTHEERNNPTLHEDNVRLYKIYEKDDIKCWGKAHMLTNEEYIII